MVTYPLLLFTLSEKPGKTADDIIEDDFQVLFESDRGVVLPVEQNMRHVEKGCQDRSQDSAAQGKPEPTQDDRHIIESTVDIVSTNLLGRGQIVQGSNQQQKPGYNRQPQVIGFSGILHLILEGERNYSKPTTIAYL